MGMVMVVMQINSPKLNHNYNCYWRMMLQKSSTWRRTNTTHAHFFKPLNCAPLQQQQQQQQVESAMKIMCEPCNGKGWLLCDFCNGQKTNVKADNNKRIYRRCPSCRAIGYILCPNCKVFKCVTFPGYLDVK